MVSPWVVATDDGSGAIGGSDRSATDAFDGLNHTIHHQLALMSCNHWKGKV